MLSGVCDRNGNEEGVDCGGPQCSPCASGSTVNLLGMSISSSSGVLFLVVVLVMSTAATLATTVLVYRHCQRARSQLQQGHEPAKRTGREGKRRSTLWFRISRAPSESAIQADSHGTASGRQRWSGGGVGDGSVPVSTRNPANSSRIAPSSWADVVPDGSTGGALSRPATTVGDADDAARAQPSRRGSSIVEQTGLRR